ncbi:MAG: serine/threonine protein kinase [Ruminococcus sp.]|nr:serine/threonine protein kinase [Ruminococcus sp.]
MDIREKFNLWQIEEVRKLSNELTIVRNILTGQLMIKRIALPDALETMRTLASFSHPNLMRIYDADLIGDKCVCLCEYIEGVTLKNAVETRGVYAENDAKTIIISICSGLCVLHQHGIIHRDINPSNVMITTAGTVKIIDYDIVRTVKEEKSKDTDILGTVGYTSPEQFGFQQTDRRADIYSCGALLNYLLTGSIPSEKLYAGALRPVIERCIEIDPDARYDSAEHLKAVLQNDRRYILRHKRDEIEELRVRPIPGFRSKHVFPKILTVFGIVIYVLALLIYLIALLSPISYGYQYTAPVILAHVFMMFEVFGFFTLFPYLLYGDVGKYTRVFTKDLRGRRIVKGLFGTLSLILGVVTFIVMISLYNAGYLHF